MSAGPAPADSDRMHILTNNAGHYYAARCSCGNLGVSLKNATYTSHGLSYGSMTCNQCGKPAVVTMEPRS